MLIPLGILASSGGGAGGSFELISSTILGSTAASVTFDVSTYASTYKHLQLRYTARSNRSNAYSGSSVRFNSDTGTNYRSHQLQTYPGYFNSNFNNNSTSIYTSPEVGGTNVANNFAATVVDILDAFSSTKNKVTRQIGGHAGSDYEFVFGSGLWLNTAAITSVTVLNWDGSSHVAGSRFSLYGIKG